MQSICKSIVKTMPILALSACSTIINGPEQDLTVITNPPKASCKIIRNNQVIGLIPTTPGTISIEKTKHPLVILCEKEGYESTQFVNPSGTAKATLGNIICGGPIGWAVDSATGSDNYYTTPIVINLVPRQCSSPEKKAP